MSIVISCYWFSRRMDSIRVNAKINGQHELTHRQFFVTRDSESGHGVDATFSLQKNSPDKTLCLCSKGNTTLVCLVKIMKEIIARKTDFRISTGTHPNPGQESPSFAKLQAARSGCLLHTRWRRTLWVDGECTRSTAKKLLSFTYLICASSAVHTQFVYRKCRHILWACRVSFR